MFFDPVIGAQFCRQSLGQPIAGGVVVMDSSRLAVTGKGFEIKRTRITFNKVRAPGFEIIDHLDNVAGPNRGELGIDQFAAMFQNLFEMQFRAVVFTYRCCKTTSRHRRRAAGRPAFGHLD